MEQEDKKNKKLNSTQAQPPINNDIAYFALQNMLKTYKCGKQDSNDIIFSWYRDNIGLVPIWMRKKIAMELKGYLYQNPNLIGCAIGNINSLIELLEKR